MRKRIFFYTFAAAAAVLAGTIFLLLNSSKVRLDEKRPQDIGRLSEQRTSQPAVDLLNPAYQRLKDFIVNKYTAEEPVLWGDTVSGVIRNLNTEDKTIALTFDACDGGGSDNGCDKELIDFLIKEKVPATLFINSGWIDANKAVFMELAANPLFEIENHGYYHKPLSVNGRSVYGIAGTASAGEAADELLLNEQKIEGLTGRKPLYYRSGTAYYDEVAVKIIYDLGLKPIGCSIPGDAGATYDARQVADACLGAVPGSIITCHMNHPEKYTAEGIKLAVPELKKRGFTFTKLENYDKLWYFAYTVAKGDTLWVISKKYSVPIRDIQILNGLNTSSINKGKKLRLPSRKY